VTVALLVLAVFALPAVGIAVLILLGSGRPVLFRQRRVGRGGRLFTIYKFRSMAAAGDIEGPGLTRAGDSRVTREGRWLRRLKLDELPQFLNVLRGEMSLVGPRPKLPQLEMLHNMPCRPGITGVATLFFHDEEQLLQGIAPQHLKQYYDRHIKPVKARLDAHYMSHATLLSDLEILWKTLLCCLHRPLSPEAEPGAGYTGEALRAEEVEEDSVLRMG
jgi:lipopolysaccharide/colanic/teichoic acid biosynthesis glycosyltransferase